MILHSLRLQHVRKHTDSAFELSPGVNVLVGPNACGKTTVLEAINMVARGKAAPGQMIKHVLSQGQEWMRIDAVFDDSSRIYRLEPQKPQPRSLEIDGVVVKRLRHDQQLPVVWFDPEELRLLRGSPARRRQYLDGLLSAVDPAYHFALPRFNRALLQRNSLLKNPRATKDQFFVWNVRFVEHAKVLAAARTGFIRSLEAQLEDTYALLSGSKKRLKPRYSIDHSGGYGDWLMSSLESRLPRDKQTGFSSVGPHRDDLIILDENDDPFGQNASRGEIRSLVLALKVIELRLLEEVYGAKPILLFDDVFSELDGARRQAFTDYLQDSQTIITTTDADIVTKDFAQHAKVIAL